MHAFSTASSEQGRGFGTAMVFRLKSLHESAAQLVAAADFGLSPATITSRSKRAEAAELGTLDGSEHT